MTCPIVLRPEASQDIRESRDYFDTRRAGLGEVFLDRLNEVLARISAMPEMYGIAWRNARSPAAAVHPCCLLPGPPRPC